MRFAAILLFTVLCLTGCGTKSKVITESTQFGASLQVKINIEPPKPGSVTFKGLPAFEKLGAVPVTTSQLVLDVPLADVPKGKHSVTVIFEGEGKKSPGEGTITFDRVAAAPSLRIAATPKPGAQDIPCKGELCATPTTRIPWSADLKLNVTLTDCAGCALDVGGQKVAIASASQAASIDLANALANAAGSEVKTDMKIPFNVTLDGATTTMNLESLGSLLVAPLFGRITSGPVAFAGDTPSTTPKSAILLRKDAGYGVVRAVGTAAKVRDYDLVGIVTATTTSLGTCGVYEKSDTKTKVNVAHKALNYDITMYDRRTAKNLGRRSFGAENRECGDTLVGGATEVMAWPSDTAMEAWAKSFFK